MNTPWVFNNQGVTDQPLRDGSTRQVMRTTCVAPDASVTIIDQHKVPGNRIWEITRAEDGTFLGEVRSDGDWWWVRDPTGRSLPAWPCGQYATRQEALSHLLMMSPYGEAESK